MDIKKVKKALMTGKLRLSDHARFRMDKRGYTKRDIISCIMSGEKVETQIKQKKLRIVIEGLDTDQLPMAAVIGRDMDRDHLVVITVMPPLSKKFTRVI